MASTNRFFCDVCNLKLISEKAMEEHLNGRKHHKVEEVTKLRQSQAKKSIFVGNLVKGMSEIEITDYFMKVGSVERVIIDKEKHQFAIVEFESEDVVEQALACKKHTIGGRKVNVKQREWKPVVGKHKQPTKKKNTTKSKVDEGVVEAIMVMENVSEQMQSLLTKLQLSRDDINLRYLICRLLQSVFKEFMPHAAVDPYGSSVNSYGVKGCDLDLNLTVDGRNLAYEFSTPPAEDEIQIDKKNLDEFDEVEMVDISDDESATMEMICKIIQQLVPGMKHVRGIPLARKPVVKFCHSQSGLMCDISINNRLALRNTELVSFYGKLHPVVRPLVFAIRQWAKVKQIAGAGPRLTNYSLTLLVITYLQIENVLPSVEELEAMNDGDDCIIDGWNCTFTRDVNKVKFIPKQQSAENLLVGFCKFYTELDFFCSLICPRKGKILSLEEFQKEATGPTKEFKIGSLNVQDPLELCHNVAGNVNDKTVKRLSGELKVAHVICQSKRFSKHDGERKSWGLMLLLKEGTGEPLKADVVGCLDVAFNGCSFSDEFRKKWEGDTDGGVSDWVNQMVSFYKMVLEDVLKFDCHVLATEKEENSNSISEDKQESMEVISQGSLKRHLEVDSCLPTKKLKVDEHVAVEGIVESPQKSDTSLLSDQTGSTDVSFVSTDTNEDHSVDMEMQSSTSSVISLPGQHLVTYSCKTKFPMWIGRRKVGRLLRKLPEYKTNVMALERAITSKVIKEQELMGDVNFKSGSMNIQLLLRKISEDDGCRLRLKMVPVTEEIECKNFFHFFENFFSKLVSNQTFH